MKRYSIMCVDHNPEIRARVQEELTLFSSHFNVVTVSNAQEARLEIEILKERDEPLSSILYEPESSENQGIEFLIELNQDDFTRNTRKILFSGKMMLSDMVDAVNQARLDYYIQKPWNREGLLKVLIDQMTTYILSHDDNFLSFAKVLDQDRIVKAHVDKQIEKYQIGFLDYSKVSDEELSKELIDALYHFFKGNDQNNACREYGPNHFLTREGEVNNLLWFLAEGEVVLKRKNTKGIDQEVMRERKGALIGVMSFISGEKAFVSTHTLTDVEVIELDHAMLAEVMKSKSKLLPLFTNLLIRGFNHRLQYSILTETKLQETLKSLETAHARLIESEKMAILGQLVAGVAHELNNPVAAILHSTENLEKNISVITGSDSFPNIKNLGRKILDQARSAAPQSTAETRIRTEKAIKLYHSRNTARKAVQLNLDDEAHFKKHFQKFGKKVESAVEYLYLFYQGGVFLRNIDVCARRIADIVKGLKNYTRPDTRKMETIDLHTGIEDTLVIFENKLKSYEVIKEYAELPLVECFPQELQQVWTNLIGNAIDATGGRGQLKIVTRAVTKRNSIDCVEVLIEDDGIGIPPDLKEKIFELNFTTKREGDFGLGIGLAICVQIINRHNGSIKVESEQGKYTRFLVTIPQVLPK
ncbi:MAG: cyclic nucleotide-binding domain-containing protein [SAR324 cluster bacterium]|nr:cyclic nucleotide-binding domain-containing protein [SAR324 cluster bacterium]